MELLFLYVEDDGRNIKKQEFNFSPRYKFHYDENENLLYFERIDNKIIFFWESPCITNITAIIGKNGTGKSNLIRYLLEHTGIEKRLVFIFEHKNKIEIHTSINELKAPKEAKISKINTSKIICYPAIYINPSIYQNTSIDSFKEKSSFDASEKNMIINDASRFVREDSIYAANVWLYHKYANTLRQLDFLLEYGDKSIPDIMLPQKCFIKSLIYPYSKSSNNKDIQAFYKKLMDFYVNSFNTEKRVGRTDVHNAFLYASLVFELYCYCYDMKIPFDWGDERALHHRTRAYIIFTLFERNQDSKIGKLLLEIDMLISEINIEYDERQQGYYISFEDAKKISSKYF